MRQDWIVVNDERNTVRGGIGDGVLGDLGNAEFRIEWCRLLDLRQFPEIPIQDVPRAGFSLSGRILPY